MISRNHILRGISILMVMLVYGCIRNIATTKTKGHESKALESQYAQSKPPEKVPAVETAPEEAVRKNFYKATVPNWQWIEVVNLTPIAQKFTNGTKMLSWGDSCGIEKGGTVYTIGAEGDRVLVGYNTPGSPTGSPCPTGVIFFLKTKELSLFNQTFTQNNASEEADKLLVERLVKPYQ